MTSFAGLQNVQLFTLYIIYHSCICDRYGAGNWQTVMSAAQDTKEWLENMRAVSTLFHTLKKWINLYRLLWQKNSLAKNKSSFFFKSVLDKKDSWLGYKISLKPNVSPTLISLKSYIILPDFSRSTLLNSIVNTITLHKKAWRYIRSTHLSMSIRSVVKT